MEISQKGIEFVKNYEHLHLEAYDAEGNGIPTIGYGHYNDSNVSFGDTITGQQANAYWTQI